MEETMEPKKPLQIQGAGQDPKTWSKVAIIILNYNGWADTIECINSLKKSKSENFKVIIIDNGSEDGSPEIIKRSFPEYTFIQFKKNLGFAKANNAGIDYVLKNDLAEYILLLNNDTILQENFIETLYQDIQKNKNYGIIGVKIFQYPLNKIDYNGGKFLRWICREKHIRKEYYGEPEIKQTEFVTGCCMLIKKEVFDDIGKFDEKYFMYCEDMDFCLRAMKSKIKLGVATRVKLWHKGGINKNTSVNLFHGARSRVILARKWLNSYQRIVFYTYFYITRMLKIIIWILTGNFKRVKIHLFGIIAGLKIKL